MNLIGSFLGMRILHLIFISLFCMGLFLITLDVLGLPKRGAKRALFRVTNKKDKEREEVFIRKSAIRLSKYLSIHELTKIKYKNKLNAANINKTPEEFLAFALVKSGVIAIFILPFLFIFPLIAIVILFISIMTYFKELKELDKGLDKKREGIEKDLPRFVATITEELKASRDVLSILENYKKNAREEFLYELDILTADMRSSSYEGALSRFAGRINSSKLSNIVSGLTRVINGDDGIMYFQVLSYTMKELELQELKAKALKIPPKIKIFSFIMLMCFMMTYIGIIIHEILSSFSSLF